MIFKTTLLKFFIFSLKPFFYFVLQGLEIYCSESNFIPHIYLTFPSESDRDSVYQLLEESPHVHLERVHIEEMTLQWQNGIVSNYDYLMYLNWYVCEFF